MRSATAVLVAGLLTAGFPVLAHAQWYAGTDVGFNFPEDQNVTVGGHDYKTSFTDLSRAGTTSDIHGGYDFGLFRLEGEFGMHNHTVYQVGGREGGGSLKAFDYMVNGYYDVPTHADWYPFLGVGVGGAWVDSHSVTQNYYSAYSGDGTAFAYQGIVGVAYDVLPQLTVDAQYRYFGTTDYSVHSTSGASANVDYHEHVVMLGMNYKFGVTAPAPQPAPVPVAAAPAPMPAPMPAPVVKPAPHNYMVFFDFDKAAITPEATSIINQAAAAAKSGSAARVTLTGNTDTVGSDKYNMALSLKRAEAVKAAMVKLGVPASEIVVVGKGKSAPLVPTKDGVREPQNRRVEIVLQ